MSTYYRLQLSVHRRCNCILQTKEHHTQQEHKGRTQCRRLPALCGVWGRVVFKPQAFTHTNVQRLGLEPGTFRLQTVGSTAAPGFTHTQQEHEKKKCTLHFRDNYVMVEKA